MAVCWTSLIYHHFTISGAALKNKKTLSVEDDIISDSFLKEDIPAKTATTTGPSAPDDISLIAQPPMTYSWQFFPRTAPPLGYNDHHWEASQRTSTMNCLSLPIFSFEMFQQKSEVANPSQDKVSPQTHNEQSQTIEIEVSGSPSPSQQTWAFLPH